jgi:hypothetical protein
MISPEIFGYSGAVELTEVRLAKGYIPPYLLS